MHKRTGNAILRTLSSIALLLAGTASVRADLLIYEGFEYVATTNAGGGSSAPSSSRLCSFSKTKAACS